LSEIGNIMSLQMQAAPIDLPGETKAEKEKAEKAERNSTQKLANKGILDSLGSTESSDNPTVAAVEDFLHADSNSLRQKTSAAQQMRSSNDASANQIGANLEHVKNLIENFMETPTSGLNGETAGSMLKSLAENIEKAYKDHNGSAVGNNSPQESKVSLGGGMVFDMVSSKITFDLSEFLKEKVSGSVSKEDNASQGNGDTHGQMPSLRDRVKDGVKVSTELVLAKDSKVEKKEALAILESIMNKPSMISKAHQNVDPNKALELLFK
jgi:hypothetical protein